MTTRVLNRIMDGARTPEGKVIAILLALCLSLMSWNAAVLGYALSTDGASAGDEYAESEVVASKLEAQQGEGQADDQAAADTNAEPLEVGQVVVEAHDQAADESAAEPQASSDAATGAIADNAASDDAADVPEASDATDTDTDADDADEDEDVAMPAQRFVQSTNGVTVTVDAPEGAFPEATQMSATDVSAGAVVDAVESVVDGEVQQVRAIDISFHNSEGKEIEPKAEIRVTFSSNVIAQAEADDALTTEVVHISDNGAASVVAQDITPASNEVAITSDDFSIYVIVTTGDNPTLRLTYNFYNEGSLVTTQYVKKSGSQFDKLYNPALEAGDGQTFIGWAENENEQDPAKIYTVDQLNQQLQEKASDTSLKDGDEFNYHAVMRESYYLRYLMQDESGDVTVLKTVKRLKSGAGTDANDLTIDGAITELGEGEVFEGWMSEDGTVYESGQEVNLSGNLNLYMKVKGRHWLVFVGNSQNGGSVTYTPPQLLFGDGAVTEEPADPTQKGYNFVGWNTRADGKGTTWTSEDFGKGLTSDVVLYAQWEGAEANYYVLYWEQNASDEANLPDDQKTYTYVSYDTRTAKTGDTVKLTNSDKNPFDRDHFKYNTSRSDQQATIAADGTTVLNVYFDRNVYKLTFKTSVNGTVVKTITALYEHSIKDEFPITGAGVKEGDRWRPQQNSHTFSQVLVAIDTMPADNVTFYRDQANNKTKYMNYYVEALPDAKGTTAYNGKSFVQYNTISANYNYITEAEDFLELTGFTKYDSDPEFNSQGRALEHGGNTINFYYTRNSYNIHFVSQGQHVTEREEATQEVPYEQSLADYAEGGSSYYEPTNGQEGWFFAGWYTDEACTVPFDFAAETMPAKDITLYAKWDTFRVRTVLVPTPDNANNDQVSFANNQSLSFRLDYNETVSDANINPNAAKRTGYKLEGWYTSPTFESETLWNFSTPVNKEVSAVDMNYQGSDDWANNTYRDNDGKHDNVKASLKLYANWLIAVDENSVYVEYEVPADYRLYDASGALQTKVPVDAQNHVVKGEDAVTSIRIASTPTDFDDAFFFEDWVLLNSDGSESDLKFSPGSTWDFGDSIENYIVTEEISGQDADGNQTTVPMRTIHLRAEFGAQSDKTARVVYDGNGGTTKSGQDTVLEGIALNKSFQLPDGSAFTREGYEFVGWATTADGTAEFTAGQTVAADNHGGSAWNEDTSENVLYAVWSPRPFKVTFVDEDGTTVLKEAITYYYGTAADDIVKPANPTKKGDAQYTYTFAGWKNADTGVMGVKDVTGNVTYQAVYTQTVNKYTVTFVDEDGVTVIDGPASYDYGTAAADIVQPTNPTKASDAQYAYTFAGWTPVIVDVTGNATYQATYTPTPIEYTIDYKLDGGTVDGTNPTVYTVRSNDFTLVNPTRTGYTFAGWTGTDLTQATETVTIPTGSTGDRAYTATWTPRTDTPYTVNHYQQNLNRDGYTLMTADTETRTGTTGEPTTAVAKSYPGFTAQPFEQAAIEGDGSTVINIYYDRNTYTVSYRYADTAPQGAPALPGNATYIYGSSVTVAGQPTLAGYDFHGWAVAAEGGANVTNGSFAMPAADVVLEGTFTARTDTGYVVKYWQQNVSGDEYTLVEADTQNLTGTTGATANAIAKSYDHFSLNETKSVMEGIIVASGKPLELNLYYDRDTVSVTYTDGVEGTEVFANQVSKVRYGATTPTFAGTPARDYYTFTGWDQTPAPIATADVTYKAQWTPVTYQITYALEGGTVAEGANPSTYTVESSDITLVKPTRNGYDFAGWTGTGLEGATSEVTIATGSTGNRAYTATWKPIEYKITYEMNGGTNAESNPSTYTIEEEVTLANPTRTGYGFAGWTENGTPNAHIAKGSTGDRTFTATWTQDRYTITYNLDGGALPQGAQNPGTYNVESSPITLVNPERTGYTFNGWTGTELAQATETVTIPTGSVGNRDYTANWSINSYSVTYRITGDIPAGAGAAPAAQQHEFNEAVTVAGAPAAPAGYTFTGWKTTQATVSDGTFAMPAGNVTFEGSFVANDDTPYAVEYYYMNDEGQYPATANARVERAGTTATNAATTADDVRVNGAVAVVEDADDAAHYSFDEGNANNVLTGAIAGDGSLVLKVYFQKQFTVQYLPGDHAAPSAQGSQPVTVLAGSTTPAAPTFAPAAGYTFAGWSPVWANTVTKDVTYVAQWAANTGTQYRVETYYMNDEGQYPETAGQANTSTRTGTTDTQASVADSDKQTALAGYVFDGANESNVLEGTIAGDDSLVLKVYFKKQLTVEYLEGAHGSFGEEATSVYSGLDYGTAMTDVPAPEVSAAAGYEFTGWGVELPETVTANATYTAQYAPVEYGITYNLNGSEANPATVSSENPTTYTVESGNITLVNPTRPGYTFTGWTGTDLSDRANTVLIPTGSTGNREYTATWEVDWSDVTVITDGAVDASANGFNVMYDGQEHTIAVTTTNDSDSIVLSEAGPFKNVNATYADDDAARRVADHSITVTVTRDGNTWPKEEITANIYKRNVTLTSESASKAYDGSALSRPTVTVGGNGFVANEASDIQASGNPNPTLVTSAPVVNKITYVKNATAGYLDGNYIVTLNEGELEVTDNDNPGTDPDNPTPVVDPTLVITKAHGVGEDGDSTYNVNEQVSFTIRVTNIYDTAATVTLEEREGVVFAESGSNTLEFSLDPGKSTNVEATYVITSADVLAGTFENTVNARIQPEGADEPKTYTATDTVTTDPIRGGLAVQKRVAEPQDAEYAIGDVVAYEVVVTNERNVDMANVVVSDQMDGSNGNAVLTAPEGAALNEDGTVTIASIPAGQQVIVPAAYTVTTEDNGALFRNTATATASRADNPGTGEGEGEDEGDFTDSSTTPGEKVRQLYTLTIHYVYADGSQAAADYVSGLMAAGDAFHVDSPAIVGFAPSLAFIASDENGMLARDLEFEVVYTPIPPAADDENSEGEGGETPVPGAGTTPTGGAGGAGGTTATTPGAGAGTGAAAGPDAGAAALAAVQAAPGGIVTIDDDGNPLVQAIDDDLNALASGAEGSGAGAWSLFDVLCTVLAVVLCIIMLVGVFGKRRKDGDDDGDDDENRAYAEDDEDADEPEERIKRRRGLRIGSLVPALLAIVLLLVTQDFSQPMALFDSWSLVFAIIAIANIALMVLSRKKTDDEGDEDEEDESGQAVYAPAIA